MIQAVDSANMHAIRMLNAILFMMILIASSSNAISESVTFSDWGPASVNGSMDNPGQVDYHTIVIEDVPGVINATTSASNDTDGDGDYTDEIGLVWYSDTGGMAYVPENGSQEHDNFSLQKILSPGTYYIIAQAKDLNNGTPGSYSVNLEFIMYSLLPTTIHGVYVHLVSEGRPYNTAEGWNDEWANKLEIALTLSTSKMERKEERR